MSRSGCSECLDRDGNNSMSEVDLIPALMVAFAVSSAFMIALRPVAKSIGLIDRPGGRKEHVGDVPIIGGMAMFGGAIAGLILLHGPSEMLLSIFVASSLLVLIGSLDDRFGLPASVRLATQVTAVLLMAYGGGLQLFTIGDPFGIGEISTGPFALLFTVMVAVTVINAYNLVDGVDGLAGSLALIAFLAVAIVAGAGSVFGAISLTIAAGILGFLLYNFPVVWNRSVHSFMGDAGSTLLGFTVLWIAISISQGPERLISPVHCLWFASIPIYDSLTCFVRRSLQGRSPFSPGRDHFHHTLKRGGFNVLQILGILSGLQFIYAAVGIFGYFAGVPDAVLFVAWSGLGLTQRAVICAISNARRKVVLRQTGEELPEPSHEPQRARVLQ